MIYLDNAATTPMSPEVVDAMRPYFNERFANPGGVYPSAEEARNAVERARNDVAGLFGCTPDQVIFTASGSESNTTVLRGLMDYLKESEKTKILIGSTEHDSIIKAAKWMETQGFEVEWVPVSATGAVTVQNVERMLDNKTGFVAVMCVNNETGVVSPVAEIGALCRSMGVWFHTDCVQAAGTIELDVSRMLCDSASISGHKLNGPKGTGALYVRDLTVLKPLVFGGDFQEYGLRGGTENVPGIVGLGTACRITKENLQDGVMTATACKQIFYTSMLSNFETLGYDAQIKVHGLPVAAVGKILNFAVTGVDAETALLVIGQNGVCASAGSACRSNSAEPSHVLTAMGISPDEARSSFRVSFGSNSTPEEAQNAALIFARCLSNLAKLNTKIL